MARIVFTQPLLVAIFAALAFVTCGVVHVEPHARAMGLAAMASALASEFAVIPLLLNRRSAVLATTQATLVGLVAHLLLCIVLSLGLALIFHPGTSFLYWMLGFYWVTLLGLVGIFVHAVRKAPARLPGGVSGPDLKIA